MFSQFRHAANDGNEHQKTSSKLSGGGAGVPSLALMFVQ